MGINKIPVTESLILQFRSYTGISVVSASTIVRVEALSNYSKLFFTNGKTLVVTKVLRWFEERLSPGEFIRPHRTHLVNRHYISQYVNGEGGKIILYNGQVIGVSKRKKQIFLRSWYGTVEKKLPAFPSSRP